MFSQQLHSQNLNMASRVDDEPDPADEPVVDLDPAAILISLVHARVEPDAGGFGSTDPVAGGTGDQGVPGDVGQVDRPLPRPPPSAGVGDTGKKVFHQEGGVPPSLPAAAAAQDSGVSGALGGCVLLGDDVVGDRPLPPPPPLADVGDTGKNVVNVPVVDDSIPPAKRKRVYDMSHLQKKSKKHCRHRKGGHQKKSATWQRAAAQVGDGTLWPQQVSSALTAANPAGNRRAQRGSKMPSRGVWK